MTPVDPAPTDRDGELKALLAEYQANVTLWQHDDMLRQQRTATFLAINTALLTAFAAVTALKVPLLYFGITLLALSPFGIAICYVWKAVLRRNREFMRFRRRQLASIEARLPGPTTFQHTLEAFERGGEITFPATGETFRVAKEARRGSSATEERLPVLIGILWLVVGIAGAVASAAALNGVAATG
jgi:hypothetical protein